MFSMKHILFVLIVAVALMAGFYMAQYFQVSHAVAETPRTELSDQTLHLCERLIRFGQAAYDRGQYAEAKHFFQKAITVYPGHAAAWKKYNMALLSLISAKVETDPLFLPEPAANSNQPSPHAPKAAPGTVNQDDGC